MYIKNYKLLKEVNENLKRNIMDLLPSITLTERCNVLMISVKSGIYAVKIRPDCEKMIPFENFTVISNKDYNKSHEREDSILTTSNLIPENRMVIFDAGGCEF